MAEDHTGVLRGEVRTRLLADGGFSSIFGTRLVGLRGQSSAQTPFAVLSVTDTSPYEATCLEGSVVVFDVHSYVVGEEDDVEQANSAIRSALDEGVLDLGGAHTVSLDWVRSVYFNDPYERGMLHGVVTFVARTSDDY